MMTEELFREDAQLLSCQARVLRHDTQGLLLDRTVCYPQGGGQAGDMGRISLADGRVLALVDTRKGAASGEILHLLDEASQAPMLPAGTVVQVAVDAARRRAHMRFHTATHLLCALVPYPVDGCSITQSYARLDFHTDQPLDKTSLTEGIARLVGLARAVHHRWISEAELDDNPQLVRSMSVQPPRGMGRVRLLDIAGIDLQPCGGTHVSNTSEVGAVVVTKIEKKSAMTRRVVLGFAAE